MPGEANGLQRIGGANFKQRLGRGNHLDQTAVFQHQRIAAAQRDGLRQIEQEFEPARTGHRHAAAVAVVEIEHDAVGGVLVEMMLPKYAGCTDHDFCSSSSGAPLTAFPE